MHYVIALLASEYDFKFPPGEFGERVEGDMQDHFTSEPGTVNLGFSKSREVSEEQRFILGVAKTPQSICEVPFGQAAQILNT